MQSRNFLARMNIFIRSLTFSMAMAMAIFLYGFVSLLAFPLPFRCRYVMIAWFTGRLVWMLKVICHVDYQVEGLENIPKDRCGVVLSKHQSTWEAFYLPTTFHHAAIILKRELLWIPFFGWGVSIIDPIAINRSKTSNAMTQVIKKGKQCLQQGRWILVFPEGTRIPYGQVGHYKAGGARLAVETGYPVIPVAHNAGYYWPKRGFIKKPGTIKVVIGPLIETKNKTTEQVLKEAKDWIEETIQNMRI